jgi:pimeloyl-ACP methyl ester carboxylesterase
VLQVDSVNVLQRAHYMPLYSRMGAYDVDLLRRASQPDNRRSPRRMVEYWAHVQAFMPVDLWPVIPRLPDPTLMIVGHESDFSPPATLERVLAANPGIGAVSIAAAGHYVHDDQPELFNDAVDAFLATARR